MNPIRVPTTSRLSVSYTFHGARHPTSDRAVVLHHGICHTREQFLPLVRQLNELGFHAAMIDQQSEHAGLFRNFIGAKQYCEGMAAAVRMIEHDHKRVGSYALHSMGALIGEEMQQQYPELRRPTILMAPIPVDGALPITLRILTRHPLTYLKTVLTLSIHSLAKTPEQVRELFFDCRTPEGMVVNTTAQLKHAPFWIYCQFVLRRMVRPRIQNDNLAKLLLYSRTDEIFHVEEYKKTRDRYPQLTQHEIEGGHDFFIEFANTAAQRIGAFCKQHDAEMIAGGQPISPPHFPGRRDGVVRSKQRKNSM